MQKKVGDAQRPMEPRSSGLMRSTNSRMTGPVCPWTAYRPAWSEFNTPPPRSRAAAYVPSHSALRLFQRFAQKSDASSLGISAGA